MPSIRRNNVAAGTPNALQGLKFEEIGANGAEITLYGSTPTIGCQISLSVEGGDREVLSLAEPNTEQNADEVNTDFDLLLINEPVGPGKMFLQVDSQIANFALFIEDG